ncbi:hypothetical protein ABPG75_004940 [Micractinium tetrahymenae]
MERLLAALQDLNSAAASGHAAPFKAAVDNVAQAQSLSWPSPGSGTLEQRSALASELVRLGQQLQEINERLRHGMLRRSPAAVELLCAAVAALGWGATACGTLDMRGGEAEEAAAALLGATPLVLCNGRMALARPLAGGGSVPHKQADQMVSQQLAVAATCVGTAYCATPASCPAVVAFSPADTARWLAAVASHLLGKARRGGAVVPDLQRFSRVLLFLLRKAEGLEALHAAVEADASLAHSCVELLAEHALPAAKAALQQLKQRSAAGGGASAQAGTGDAQGFWAHHEQLQLQLPYDSVAALQADCLQAARGQQLRQARQRAAALQLAGQLISELFAAVPAEEQDRGHLSTLVELLELFEEAAQALEWQRPSPSAAERAQQQRATAWAVLRLLPPLAAAARAWHGDALASGVLAVAVTDVLRCATAADEQLGEAASAGDLAEALRAADCGLRLLPLLAETAGKAGQEAVQAQQAAETAAQQVQLALWEDGQAGSGLAVVLLQVFGACARLAERFAGPVELDTMSQDAGRQAAARAAAAAAAPAVLQLLVTAGRLAFWVASSGGPARRPASWAAPLVLPAIAHQARRLDTCYAILLRAFAVGLEPGSAARQLIARQRAAANAALWEVLALDLATPSAAAAEGSAAAEAQHFIHMEGLLAAAVGAAPWMLVLHPELPQLLASSLSAVLASGLLGDTTECAAQVLAVAAHHARLAAALVAGGALGSALASALAVHGASRLGGDAAKVTGLARAAVKLMACLAAAADKAVAEQGPEAVPEQLTLSAARLRASLPPVQHATEQAVEQQLGRLQHDSLPYALAVADQLQKCWEEQQAGRQAAAQLELAQAAATRSCAYLRCANLGAEGGPGAGQQPGSKRCGGCRAVWYCGTACQHADWREGGHRRMCAALAAARQQEQLGQVAN